MTDVAYCLLLNCSYTYASVLLAFKTKHWFGITNISISFAFKFHVPVFLMDTWESIHIREYNRSKH